MRKSTTESSLCPTDKTDKSSGNGKTVAFIQEHGYDSQEDFAGSFSEAQMQTTEMRKALRLYRAKLKEVNEQIHYTGQYLANKSVYGQFLKSKIKSNSGRNTNPKLLFMKLLVVF